MQDRQWVFFLAAARLLVRACVIAFSVWIVGYCETQTEETKHAG